MKWPRWRSTRAAASTRATWFGLTDGEEAIFKPLGGVDQRVAAHYGHRPEETLLHECAAWQLAKLLGPPYSEMVPACVWREFQGVWGDVEGVLALKVSGDWFHFDRPFAAAPDQCMAAALFDSVSAQQDRHAANYLWDEAQQRLHLIDHGYGFAREGDPSNVTMFVAWRHTAAAQLTAAEHGSCATRSAPVRWMRSRCCSNRSAPRACRTARPDCFATAGCSGPGSSAAPERSTSRAR